MTCNTGNCGGGGLANPYLSSSRNNTIQGRRVINQPCQAGLINSSPTLASNMTGPAHPGLFVENCGDISYVGADIYEPGAINAVMEFYNIGFTAGLETANHALNDLQNDPQGAYAAAMANQLSGFLSMIFEPKPQAAIEADLAALDGPHPGLVSPYLNNLAIELSGIIHNSGLSGPSAAVNASGSAVSFEDLHAGLSNETDPTYLKKLIAMTIDAISQNLNVAGGNDPIKGLFSTPGLLLGGTGGPNARTGILDIITTPTSHVPVFDAIKQDVAQTYGPEVLGIMDELRTSGSAFNAGGSTAAQIANGIIGPMVSNGYATDIPGILEVVPGAGNSNLYATQTITAATPTEAITKLLTSRKYLKEAITAAAGGGTPPSIPIPGGLTPAEALQKMDAQLLTLLSTTTLGKLHSVNSPITFVPHGTARQGVVSNSRLLNTVHQSLGTLRNRAAAQQQRMQNTVGQSTGVRQAADELFKLAKPLVGLGMYSFGTVESRMPALDMAKKLLVAGLQEAIYSTAQSNGIQGRIALKSGQQGGQPGQNAQGAQGQQQTTGTQEVKDPGAVVLASYYSMTERLITGPVDVAEKSGKEGRKFFEKFFQSTISLSGKVATSGLAGQSAVG